MNKDIEYNLKRCVKLPALKVATLRSNSARLTNEKVQNELEESTPYFNYSENQEIDSAREDLSIMFQQILQEQKQLKMKIQEQSRMIEKIYKKRPPLPVKFKNSELLIEKENIERSLNVPVSAKENKKFRFPREIFTSKPKTRQT